MLLHQLIVLFLRQHSPTAHQRLPSLLPNCEVVVLKKGRNHLVEELLMIVVGQGLEETRNALSNCEFEPPLFIVEAPLDQRNQVLGSPLGPHHLACLDHLLHGSNPNGMVFVLEQPCQQSKPPLIDFFLINGAEVGNNGFHECQLDGRDSLLIALFAEPFQVGEKDVPGLLDREALGDFWQLNEGNCSNFCLLIFEQFFKNLHHIFLQNLFLQIGAQGD